MKQYLDQFKKLSLTARLSLFITLLLFFTIGITINNALTKKQEKRTHAATNCTITVAQDGTGNYTTIQAAADVAVAGDTVCVKAGTYFERIKPKNSGTFGNYIKFIAQGEVILDTRSLAEEVAVVQFMSKDWMWVEGFKIYNKPNEYAIFTGINAHVTTPWQTKFSSDIMIKNNTLIETNGFYNGIRAGDYGGSMATVGKNKRIIVDGNIIELPTTPPAQTLWGNPESISFSNVDQGEIKNNRIINAAAIGIDLKSGNTNIKVYNNTIESPAAQGIYVDGYAFYAGNIEIYNNFIFNAGQRIGIPIPGIIVNLESGAQGNIVSSIEHVKIYNNIVDGATWHGVVIGGESNAASTVRNRISDIQIISNTIVNSEYEGIRIDEWGHFPAILDTVVVRNNLMKGNKNNASDNIDSATIPNLTIEYNHYTVNTGANTGTNFTTGDPLFASATDFHLQAGSPAIDAGFDARAIFNFDLDGNTRPAGAGFDIGAYEYCVGAGCVIAPISSSPNPTSGYTTPPLPPPPLSPLPLLRLM